MKDDTSVKAQAQRGACQPTGWSVAARLRLIGYCGVLLISAALAGCSQGVTWDEWNYDDAIQESRARQQLAFVYVRSWYSVDCTNFEEKVLKDPAVLAETRDMVCVPLEFGIDRKRVLRWGMQHPPAYALIAPNGEVLAKREGAMTVEELLEDIRAAKGALEARGGGTRSK